MTITVTGYMITVSVPQSEGEGEREMNKKITTEEFEYAISILGRIENTEMLFQLAKYFQNKAELMRWCEIFFEIKAKQKT